MKKVTEKQRLRDRARAHRASRGSGRRPTPRLRELTQDERSARFRKVQRATELREIAMTARERHHNIDVWHAEQRKKIEEKYQ